jgi:hypothetical protein
VSVWSWLKLTICLWLLRKTVKATGWLLLLAAVIAAWPLTAVALAGYTTAWWRGWPPAWLRRTAGWPLLMAPAWLAAAAADPGRWRAAALGGLRSWEHGWHHPAALTAARTFLLLAPAVVPAGLGLAAVLWWWRNYAITTGLGGFTASAPIIFDARQWRRAARTPGPTGARPPGWSRRPGFSRRGRPAGPRRAPRSAAARRGPAAATAARRK